MKRKGALREEVNHQSENVRIYPSITFLSLLLLCFRAKMIRFHARNFQFPVFLTLFDKKVGINRLKPADEAVRKLFHRKWINFGV